VKGRARRVAPATAAERLYQAYYCEENVWQLCRERQGSPGARTAVFISNALASCPVWNQRAGRGQPVFWDYHVVLLSHEPFEIWDLDTTLGMPVPALDYLEQSFDAGVPAPLLPMFRLVDADVFLETFASDRAHMLDEDGRYREPPPSWPPIGKAPSNLMRFVDMEQPFLGEVLTLAELMARVGQGT
jgi:hypothetical protein